MGGGQCQRAEGKGNPQRVAEPRRRWGYRRPGGSGGRGGPRRRRGRPPARRRLSAAKAVTATRRVPWREQTATSEEWSTPWPWRGAGEGGRGGVTGAASEVGGRDRPVAPCTRRGDAVWAGSATGGIQGGPLCCANTRILSLAPVEEAPIWSFHRAIGLGLVALPTRPTCRSCPRPCHRLPALLRAARCSCYGRPPFRLPRSPLPTPATPQSLSTVSVLPLVEPHTLGWRPSRLSLLPLRPWATLERPRRRRAAPRLVSAPLPPPRAPGRSLLPVPCRPPSVRGFPPPLPPP